MKHLKKYISFAILLSIAGFYQNCGSQFVSMNGEMSQNSNGAGADFSFTADPALQQSSLQIISIKCGACHQDSSLGGIGQILDIKYNIATNLITPGDPTKGRLIGSIEDNSMPTSVAMRLTAAELTTLKDWISSIQVTGPVPPATTPPPVLPAGKTVNSDPTLYRQSFSILNVNCAGCHNTVALGGIMNILKVDSLVSSGLVTVGDPLKGRLLGSITDGTMPVGAASVTAADLATLKSWVSSMQIVDVSATNTPKIVLPALAPTYTSIRQNIFEPKCVGCHGPVRADDGKRYDTYANVVRFIDDSTTSGIPNSMPPSPYPKLTAEERTAIRTWVTNGKLDN